MSDRRLYRSWEQRNELRDLLERSISDMERKIQEFKHTLNKLTEISELPDDVLRQIFVFAKLDSTSAGSNSKPNLDWIKATSHVCHHWRDIALKTRSLWTEMHNFNDEWAKEMMSRSRSNTLTFTIHFDIHRLSSFSYTLSTFQHAAHIGVLNLLSNIPQDAALLLLFCESTIVAPRLHTLRIFRAGRFKLSDKHLKAQQLCRLALIGCGVDWRASFLRGLTHLRVRDLPKDPARADTYRFILALGQMPQLESLDIQDSLSPINVLPAHEVAHLAKLKLLRLTASVLAMGPFMLSIVVPPAAVLKLHCELVISEARTTSSSFKDLVTAFKSHFRQPAFASESSLFIRSFDCSITPSLNPHGLRFRAWPEVISVEDMTSYSTPALLELYLFPEEFDFPHLIPLAEALIHSMISNMQYVAVLKTNVRFRTEHWVRTFATLNELRCIQVRHFEGFLDAATLVQKPKTSKSKSSGPAALAAHVFFPALQMLWINDGSFDCETREPQETLVERLIQRYELGAEIPKLILEDCSQLGCDDVHLLEEVVVDVGWDWEFKGFEDQSGERPGSWTSDEDDAESRSCGSGGDEEEKLQGDSDIDSADELLGVWY